VKPTGDTGRDRPLHRNDGKDEVILITAGIFNTGK